MFALLQTAREDWREVGIETTTKSIASAIQSTDWRMGPSVAAPD
jgi:hypothetical protein